MPPSFTRWTTEETNSSYTSSSDFQPQFSSLNPQGHVYGILQPFSGSGSTSHPDVGPETADSIGLTPTSLPQTPHGAYQSPHSPSPSISATNSTSMTSLQQQMSYGYPASTTTSQIYSAPSVLSSSPSLDLQKARRANTIPQSEGRQRSRLTGSEMAYSAMPGNKRRRSFEMKPSQDSASVEESQIPHDLSDEEKLLIKLKQEQNMPWKDISREFEQRLGRPYQVPALQMRYKRLKERLRSWTDQDVSRLDNLGVPI